LNRSKLLERITHGHFRNVSFDDFVALVEGFGFRSARREGSQQAFVRPGVAEIVNLQPVLGEAKPYQIRQFLRLVEKYNLRLENRE